ncbi:MAG: hypothetical protein ACTSRP_20165, partial [Candidatus Helarchaeota archaeon]
MVQNKKFKRNIGKVKNKRYSYRIRVFPEIGLIPQSPFLNINRSKKIAVIKKESLKKIKKYHNYRKMK